MMCRWQGFVEMSQTHIDHTHCRGGVGGRKVYNLGTTRPGKVVEVRWIGLAVAEV